MQDLEKIPKEKTAEDEGYPPWRCFDCGQDDKGFHVVGGPYHYVCDVLCNVCYSDRTAECGDELYRIEECPYCVFELDEYCHCCVGHGQIFPYELEQIKRLANASTPPAYLEEK